MGKKLLALAGGGTGGHFFPMLAFAEYVRERGIFKGLVYIGDKDGIEAKKDFLLWGLMDEYKFLSVAKFRGRTFVGKFLSIIQNAIATLKVASYLQFSDFISVTFGGYTSVPLGLYTKLAFKPLFIHEQNSIPGKGNTFLGNFAERVFIGFPRAERFFPDYKVVLTGIPIRREVKRYKGIPREKILKSLKWDDKFTILVLGGSQGAKTLNQIAVWLSQQLPSDVRIIHITGESQFKSIKALYQINPPKCEVRLYPFVEDIGRFYRISDIAISRAGASTSAELSFFGIPTVFIPYPYAVDDHQFYNAYYYVEMGGAYVFREEELEFKKLLDIVLQHFKDEYLHQQKREAMERSFIPNAEEKMLREISLALGESFSLEESKNFETL